MPVALSNSGSDELDPNIVYENHGLCRCALPLLVWVGMEHVAPVGREGNHLLWKRNQCENNID